MSEIEEIRERLESATPGPWNITPSPSEIRIAITAGEDREFVAQLYHVDPLSEENADLIAHAPEDIAFLLAEVDRLTSANDRLAKIASSVAVALEQGKRDLMAHGWETATAEWLTRGDLYWLKEQGEDPLTYNPFRGEPEGLES